MFLKNLKAKKFLFYCTSQITQDEISSFKKIYEIAKLFSTSSYETCICDS